MRWHNFYYNVEDNQLRKLIVVKSYHGSVFINILLQNIFFVYKRLGNTTPAKPSTPQMTLPSKNLTENDVIKSTTTPSITGIL